MSKLILLLFSSIILLACSKDNVTPTGIPQWVEGYPKVAFGSKSADLLVNTDKSATVYWVISTKELTAVTGEDIKIEAMSPTNSSILFNGSFNVDAETEVVNTVDNLDENTKYFFYTAAENSSDLLLQEGAFVSNFTTHIRQDVKTYQSVAENRAVSYLIYQPEMALKYPNEDYPILFFLGGNGEVAAQGQINMIRNGSLPEYISLGNDVPMLVMSIQHTVPNWNVAMIHEGVLHALATLPVDESKVYMTGISGGGFGCWNYAVAHANVLTAIVPISGGGNQAKACDLNMVAISAFHNQTDGIVGSSNSINMIQAVNNCSRTEPAELLLFPDTGHDCWRRVYNRNHPNWSKSPSVAKFDIYEWLLSKSK